MRNPIRWARVGGPPCVMLALDHGVTLGPVAGIEDPRAALAAAAGHATCATVHRGLVGLASEHAASMGVLLHLSAGTAAGPDPHDKRLVASVAEAARLGCDGVSIHLNLGAPTEGRQLEEAGRVAAACGEWGMPLVAMVYPRGPGVPEPAPLERVAHAARLGAELGADAVKVPYAPGFRDVVRGCPVPVLVAGGERRPLDGFLEELAAARAAGAAGVSVGRNVFQSGDPRGAVGILNATATGLGCSLAVDAPAEATCRLAEPRPAGRPAAPRRTPPLPAASVPPSPLLAELARLAAPVLGLEGTPALEARTAFPPRRGLKTSSSAAAAALRALADAAGARPGADWMERTCCEAALAAGVSLTGAFDDQVAVMRGGCWLTDNTSRAVLERLDPPARWVAAWVPAAEVPKEVVARIPVGQARRGAAQALAALRSGDPGRALTLNGAAFHRLYAAAGLPVDDRPAQAALAAGALGAGLSGTGPAVAALFDAPAELEPVVGGAWSWHRVVA
jgi:shikimate kinase